MTSYQTVLAKYQYYTWTWSGVSAGVAAKDAKTRKFEGNDSNCAKRGWVCIPLAVENLWSLGSRSQL